MPTINDSVQFLKGVGPAFAKKFEKLGILTIRDLLLCYPRKYIDYTQPYTVVSAPYDVECCVRATVLQKEPARRVKGGRVMNRVLAADDSGILALSWFNAPYAADKLEVGETYYFEGRIGGALTRRELLQHCGPWPISVAQEKPTIGYPLAFSHPGAVEAQAKLGEMTLVRFDGDNGEYSLLLGNAKGVEGPYTKGTYVWVEVQNLKRLEAKIVEGPYIHHCVGIHENVVPVLYEACKYIGIAPDLYDPIEEDVKAYLRGE